MISNNPWTCSTVRGLCVCEVCRDYRAAKHNAAAAVNAERNKAADEVAYRKWLGC